AAPAHVQDHTSAFDEWRARGPEVALRNLVLRVQVMPPQSPARLQTDCPQQSVRAENEHASVCYRGRRTRPLVEAELVLITRRLLVPPDAFAVAGPQAVETGGVLDPMVNQDAVADDDRTAPAGADGVGPRARRRAGGPAERVTAFVGDAVSVRAEELRPVGGGRREGENQAARGRGNPADGVD